MFKVNKEEVKQRMVPVFPAGYQIRGWDIAGSVRKNSPYTASVKLVEFNDTLYIGGVTRERKEIEEAEEHIIATARLDGPDVFQDLPQDPGSAGKSQKRHLAKRLAKVCTAFALTVESGDKSSRAAGPASLWNSGGVVLVGSPADPWVDPFLSELASFPRGEFKDQVDAFSRAYSRWLVQPEEAAPAGAEEVEVDPDEEMDHELVDDDESVLY